MATVIVVEPNVLLRFGILQLLQKMKGNLSSEGIGYTQLFDATNKQQAADLMLLSVPDVYARMLTLLGAAQQNYAPKRILLLSNVQTLPYSLLNLPPTLAGYISKCSSQDVLSRSVSLVLAGGKCFPSPDFSEDTRQADSGTPHIPPGPAPKRRWYDQSQPLPDAKSEDVQPVPPPGPQQNVVLPNRPPSGSPPESLPADLANQESQMLHLTPRQYEILTLIARGYPLKKVSRELDISVATAKAHTKALYLRLSVNNRNEAVYAAISRGATLGWYDLDDHDQNPFTKSAA